METVFLNQKELAQRWGLSPRTLERWRWLGEGPTYVKIVGHVVYRLEDIEAYELANLRKSTTEQPDPFHATGVRYDQ